MPNVVKFFVFQYLYFCALKLFIRGQLHMLLMSIFNCLQITLYSKGKVPLFALRNEVRERVVNVWLFCCFTVESIFKKTSALRSGLSATLQQTRGCAPSRYLRWWSRHIMKMWAAKGLAVLTFQMCPNTLWRLKGGSRSDIIFRHK